MADMPDQLAHGLATFADPAIAHWPTRKKLLRVVELALGAIGGCDAAGVALIGPLGLDGEVCTGVVAYRLDQAQWKAGGGPGRDAVRSLRIFNVGVIAGAAAWPEFRTAAAENGIRSSMSVPLAVRGVAVGMLNLYSQDLNGFEHSEGPAATFAAAVSSVVAPVEARRDPESSGRHDRAAVTSYRDMV